MIYDKHTEKLIRIQFREMLCSIDSAQKWLNAKRQISLTPLLVEAGNFVQLCASIIPLAVRTENFGRPNESA